MDPLTDAHTHTAGPAAGAGLRIVNLPPGDGVAPLPGAIPGLEPGLTPGLPPRYSVGVHPHFPTDHSAAAVEAEFDRVRRLAPRAAAVGECGLDRRELAAGWTLERQLALFRRHALLAEELGLPLLIHAVRAQAEVLRLKRELAPVASVWVLHGFRGKERAARELTEAGIVLSCGAGLLLTPPAQLDYYARLPAEALLIETDEKTSLLEALYAVGAELRGLSPAAFRQLIYTNFTRIFHHDRD